MRPNPQQKIVRFPAVCLVWWGHRLLNFGWLWHLVLSTPSKLQSSRHEVRNIKFLLSVAATEKHICAKPQCQVNMDLQNLENRQRHHTSVERVQEFHVHNPDQAHAFLKQAWKKKRRGNCYLQISFQKCSAGLVIQCIVPLKSIPRLCKWCVRSMAHSHSLKPPEKMQ